MKIIATGDSFVETRKRLQSALDQVFISGVDTNISSLALVLFNLPVVPTTAFIVPKSSMSLHRCIAEQTRPSYINKQNWKSLLAGHEIQIDERTVQIYESGKDCISIRVNGCVQKCVIENKTSSDDCITTPMSGIVQDVYVQVNIFFILVIDYFVIVHALR